MVLNNIRKFRIEFGMSQTEFAEAIRISLPHLQRIEAGVQPVRLEVAGRISESLSQPLDKIFPAARRLLT